MSSSESLTSLLSVLGQTIIVVSLGIMARKFNWLPQDISALSVVVGRFALPAIFFMYAANLDVGSYNWAPIAAVMTSKLIMIAVAGFVAWIGRFEPLFSCWGIFGLFLHQSNDVALGIPLIKFVTFFSTIFF